MKIIEKSFASSDYLKQIEDWQEWFQGDEVLEVFSSGSTGEPKLVRIEREHVLRSAQASVDFFKIGPESKILLVLPLNRIGGIMLLIRATLAKAQLVPVDPSLYPFEELPAELNFDFASLVPNQLEANLHNLARIKKVLVGGGPVHPSVERELARYRSEVWHSYASTETISHVALRRLNPDHSFYYQALDGVHFDVNQAGELIIEAPHLGLNGLQTKDQVALKDRQSFRWLGRSDNVVLSGGLKIYPEELEQKLSLEVPFFLDKAEDINLGEQLILVLLEEDYQDSIISEIRSQLSGADRPKAIFTVSHFHYTDNGKLKRKASRADAKLRQKL